MPSNLASALVMYVYRERQVRLVWPVQRVIAVTQVQWAPREARAPKAQQAPR